MPKWLVVALFISGAALTWGTYVPSIHVAAGDKDVGLHSNLRAFLFVGVAYFLVAVLIPLGLIFANADPTAGTAPGRTANWNGTGITWGIFAGALGAAGALCVIFAVTASKGSIGPLYVAPLVFAGAPIVNTIATLVYFHPVKELPDWKFFLGLAMAAAGAVMVMLFKPADKPAGPAPATTAQVEETSALAETAAVP